MRTILTFIALAVAAPALAEPLPLSAISTYLNGLETAQGKFTQINPDGTIATGSIAIHRPGRVRFDYDPPDPALVMAGGGTVAIFDRKSNEPPQQFPLKRTPLSVILEREVDLTAANMVTDHREDGPSTVLRAQDPENPDIGYIELFFTAEPTELRKWVISDESGSQTTIILAGMERDIRLNASLFSVQDEIRKQANNR